MRTPRGTVGRIGRRNALLGRKYGVEISTVPVAPSTIVWYSARDAVARSAGELFTAKALTSPARLSGLYVSTPVRISPQHSIQFSATIPAMSETTGPSIRAIMSRHIG